MGFLSKDSHMWNTRRLSVYICIYNSLHMFWFVSGLKNNRECPLFIFLLRSLKLISLLFVFHDKCYRWILAILTGLFSGLCVCESRGESRICSPFFDFTLGIVFNLISYYFVRCPCMLGFMLELFLLSAAQSLVSSMLVDPVDPNSGTRARFLHALDFSFICFYFQIVWCMEQIKHKI